MSAPDIGYRLIALHRDAMRRLYRDLEIFAPLDCHYAMTRVTAQGLRRALQSVGKGMSGPDDSRNNGNFMFDLPVELVQRLPTGVVELRKRHWRSQKIEVLERWDLRKIKTDT